jgi:hypothetical protein
MASCIIYKRPDVAFEVVSFIALLDPMERRLKEKYPTSKERQTAIGRKDKEGRNVGSSEIERSDKHCDIKDQVID